MEKILIVGAGFMGSGIAQVSAQAGYQVYLMDIQTEITDRALKRYSMVCREVGDQGSSQRTFSRSDCPDFSRKGSIECIQSGLGH